MTAELFFRRLAKLPAAQQVALKATATNPLAPDVIAHDGFSTVYWNSSFRRDSARIAAALYFWHPKPGGRGCLPEALAQIRGDDHRKRNERLLADILAAPLSGLPPLLFEAVRRLKGANVALCWPQLLNDLGRWDRPSQNQPEPIQDVWANCWLDAVPHLPRS